MLEKTIFGDEKSKFAVEQHDAFVKEVADKTGINSFNAVKLLMGQLLLNIYNRIKPGLSNQSKLKLYISKLILKTAGADHNLIKSLKTEEAAFECSSCRIKSIKIDAGTFLSTCIKCSSKTPIFIQGNQIEFLLDRDLICRYCGVYHPASSKKCLLCRSSVTSVQTLHFDC